jgi:hypothetical protein
MACFHPDARRPVQTPVARRPVPTPVARRPVPTSDSRHNEQGTLTFRHAAIPGSIPNLVELPVEKLSIPCVLRKRLSNSQPVATRNELLSVIIEEIIGTAGCRPVGYRGRVGATVLSPERPHLAMQGIDARVRSALQWWLGQKTSGTWIASTHLANDRGRRLQCA